LEGPGVPPVASQARQRTLRSTLRPNGPSAVTVIRCVRSPACYSNGVWDLENRFEANSLDNMRANLGDENGFRSKSVPSANGIRGMACLIVLVVHSFALVFPETYAYLTGCGKIGVWLFFSLSAYLLTHQFLDRGFTSHTVLSYFVSRFFRIYPLFCAALVIGAFSETIGLSTLDDMYKALLFEKGFAHLWTVPVEVKFYLCLPLVFYALQMVEQTGGIHSAVVCVVVAIVVHQVFFPYWETQESSIDTVWYLPTFAFGVLGAFINRNGTPAQEVNKAASIFGISILLLILIATPFARYFLFGMLPSRDITDKHVLIGLTWSAFIVIQARYRTWLSPIFSSRCLSRIGDWSYSIYLVHWVILVKLSSHSPRHISTVILVILVSILMGAVVYQTIERCLMSAKTSFLMAISCSATSRANRA
jgi:peptidoglycan/LPS O-acetylase OafA/YrhL